MGNKALLLWALLLWLGCGQKTIENADVQGDSSGLVGMQVCRSCHADKYESYIQTGMGRSFGAATTAFSRAVFSPDALVYDTANNLYYRPFLRGDSIYIQEFRLRGADTIHQRTEKVDFVIGSGHHTHSHLIWRNGYLYQAPITFYVQQQRWDLAPGFERENERFGRWIAAECLTCHNHYPQQVAGSEHQYTQMPLGIECERCHGAGKKHVEEKMAGRAGEGSIVNPRRLSITQQMDICQRCHLQGIAVLKVGRTFYDFQPGDTLSKTFDVYLPRFTDSDERFIMASQADRLRLSPCFVQSGQLSCITCHNPHHDVHSTDKNRYNSSCTGCHHAQTTQSKLLDCSVDAALRQSDNGNNCVGCHLPRSGSIDIPHITISDHNIGRSTARQPKGTPISNAHKQAVAAFLGIQNLTNPNASDLDYAKGYLALYDKFMQQPAVLDSAWLRLQRSAQPIAQKMPLLVHYYFARQQYAAVVEQAKNTANTDITDAWTAYRIGESLLKIQQPQQAESFLAQAVALKPHFLDFKEKWALVLAQNKKTAEAQTAFEQILAQEPYRQRSLTNLGFLFAQQGNTPKAMQLYDRALAADPDYESALLNKAALCLRTGKNADAKALVQRVLSRSPRNAQALELMRLMMAN